MLASFNLSSAWEGEVNLCMPVPWFRKLLSQPFSLILARKASTKRWHFFQQSNLSVLCWKKMSPFCTDLHFFPTGLNTVQAEAKSQREGRIQHGQSSHHRTAADHTVWLLALVLVGVLQQVEHRHSGHSCSHSAGRRNPADDIGGEIM